MSIDDWRVQIDELDADLLRLLNERARIALKVGDSKKQAGASLCDHTREREVIERLSAANEGPLDDRAIVELYRAIIHESRRIQNLAHHPSPESRTPRFSGAGNGSRRVAFQGARGAFSEEAATKLLGEEITLVPRPSFESLFEAINDQSANCILAPIENSLGRICTRVLRPASG